VGDVSALSQTVQLAHSNIAILNDHTGEMNALLQQLRNDFDNFSGSTMSSSQNAQAQISSISHHFETFSSRLGSFSVLPNKLDQVSEMCESLSRHLTERCSTFSAFSHQLSEVCQQNNSFRTEISSFVNQDSLRIFQDEIHTRMSALEIDMRALKASPAPSAAMFSVDVQSSTGTALDLAQRSWHMVQQLDTRIPLLHQERCEHQALQSRTYQKIKEMDHEFTRFSLDARSEILTLHRRVEELMKQDRIRAQILDERLNSLQNPTGTDHLDPLVMEHIKQQDERLTRLESLISPLA
jgi:uncharacterized phage infection (PIP) family protein YhgE